MGKEEIYFYKSKIRYFMPLFALCVSLVIFSGCSKGEKESTKAKDGGKQAGQKRKRQLEEEISKRCRMKIWFPLRLILNN